jgi:hypothetical protein
MKPKKISQSTPMTTTPTLRPVTDEQVAALAYAIWLDRGQPQGCDVEHWLEAERQLRGVVEPLVDENRLDPALAPAARVDRALDRIVSPPGPRSPTAL